MKRRPRRARGNQSESRFTLLEDKTSLPEASLRRRVPPPPTAAEILRSEFPKQRWTANSIFLALPAKLLDELAKVDGLFDAKDLAFERRLRFLTATGIAAGHPIYSDVLDSEARAKGEFPESSVHSPRLRLERATSEELGLPHLGGVDGFALQAKVRPKMMSHKLLLQAKGYAGWLATHAAFQQEWAEFKHLHPAWLDSDERFARDRWEGASVSVETLTTGVNFGEAESEYGAFLRRWCLNSILAWHLPDPIDIRIRIDGTSFIESHVEGVEVAIPWPLLRSSKIDLAGFLSEQVVQSQQAHLRPWLRSKSWGPDRYGRLLEYYVYLHFVLHRRYSSKLTGRLEKIDLAFARYWAGKQSSEKMLATLKKIKAHLSNRLKLCDAAIAAAVATPSVRRSTRQRGSH